MQSARLVAVVIKSWALVAASMPNRFVSFMDILGFGTFVESNDIQTVIHSLQNTLSMVPILRTVRTPCRVCVSLIRG